MAKNDSHEENPYWINLNKLFQKTIKYRPPAKSVTKKGSLIP